MSYKPDFPCVFADHWGYMHVMLSAASAKDLFDEYIGDYVADYEDFELNALIETARDSEEATDWFAVIDFFAEVYGDECWMRQEAKVYE